MGGDEYPWLDDPWEDELEPEITPEIPPEVAAGLWAAFDQENTLETIHEVAETAADTDSQPNSPPNEAAHEEHLWFTRLLRRLALEKETRIVAWNPDLELHLLNALGNPEIAGKPSNMPTGIWYWVTRASEHGEIGWYILLMVVAANRPRPAGLAIMVKEIMAGIEKDGLKYTLNQQRLSPETLKRLPFNTRRLLDTPKTKYRRRAFHLIRFHVWSTAGA